MIRAILKEIGAGFGRLSDATKQNSQLESGVLKGGGDFVSQAEKDAQAGNTSLLASSGKNIDGKDIKKAVGAFKSLSDENTKDSEMNNDSDRLDALAKINSYDFTYKPEIQENLGVDGKEHTGVMAQELETNPMYKGVVDTDPATGYKTLDIKALTMANTAAISDLARQIEELKRGR